MSTFLRDRIYACALGAVALVAVVAVTLAAIDGGSSPDAHAVEAQPTVEVSATPVATPVAVKTPQLWEALLDTRRVLDVKTLSDALASYEQRFGLYPTTAGNFTWVCKTGFESACGLSKVKASLPYNDGQYDYLYRSDGAGYTLITRLQTATKTDTCSSGDAAAAQLTGSPVYCISLAGGR